MQERVHNARKACYACVTDALEDLENQLLAQSNPDSDQAHHLRGEFEGMLDALRGVEDEFFLLALYSWLLPEHRNKYLTTAKGWLVERFLRDEERFDLLWQFYLHNFQFEEAARILKWLAELSGPQAEGSKLAGWPRNLEDRVMYLTYALMYLTNCNCRVDEALLHDIQHAKHEAELQVQVRDALVHQGVLDQQRLDVLQHHLLSLSDMYNKYTSRHELHALSLDILLAANHSDPGLPRKLWAALLDRAGRGPGAGSWRARHVRGKVKEGAARLGSSAVVFPIDFICEWIFDRELEDADAWLHSCASGDAAWVAMEMVDADVAFSDLYDVYSALLQKHNTAGTPRQRTFALFTVVDLLTHWAAMDPAAMGKFVSRPDLHALQRKMHTNVFPEGVGRELVDRYVALVAALCDGVGVGLGALEEPDSVHGVASGSAFSRLPFQSGVGHAAAGW